MHAYVDWVAVAFLYLALPVLVAKLSARRDLVERTWERFTSWAAARSDRSAPDEAAVVEFGSADPDAADLRAAARLERLRFDLERLRRLVAVDGSMSATRQLGNRLAYHQLREQIASECGPSSVAPPAAVAVAAAKTVRPVQSRSGPEILDFRWR